MRNAHVAPLDLTARAQADHVRQLRIALRQWLRTAAMAPALAEDLMLAGYEALANVVEHAYPPDHPHPVMRLQAQVCLPLLRITITDHGRWRSPIREGGYRGGGLAVMRAVTTLTHLIRGIHGTTVVLFAGLAVRRYEDRSCCHRSSKRGHGHELLLTGDLGTHPLDLGLHVIPAIAMCASPG